MSPATANPPPPPPQQLRILIINPNTSTSMTSALEPIVKTLPFPNISFSFFTCPRDAARAIPSINSPQDAVESAEACWPYLREEVVAEDGDGYDGFLVACYSHHPLVGKIKAEVAREGKGRRRQYVTGIFEASVLMCLNVLAEEETFGIVSTGKVWEVGLTVAVNKFLGLGDGEKVVLGGRFSGCETTGLNASELHELPAEEVRGKMRDATKRLLRNGDWSLGAICLGCAGMVGLDDAVREACIEELGVEKGGEVRIVDGVKAGVSMLVASARGGF